MFLIRELGSILRGDAAPMQLVMASLAGALIGFVPGRFDHPGLLLAWLLLLVVLNANIGLALLVAAGAKLASLLLMPVSFAVGRWLLDGPGAETIAWANNAPLLALLDLEYYAVSGGILVGAALGLLSGIVLAVTLSRFRRRFAGLEQDSERYKKLTSKRSTRILLWLLLGGRRGKKSYGDLSEKRFGSPIRKSGVALVTVLVALFLFVPELLSGPFLTSAAREGLAAGNGATVDLAGLTLDTKAGRLVLEGLAMADSAALENDVLRALTIEADGSMDDLLRGRLALDRVVIIQGKNDVARSTPGELLSGDEARGPPPGPVEDSGSAEPGKGLDDYLSDAKEWRQRLGQLRQWLDKLSPEDAQGAAPADETLAERLAREVAEKGYANVIAENLVQLAPAFTIREIIADGLASSHLPGDPLDIRATNLSTAPELSDEPMRLTMQSQSGAFSAELALGGRSADPADNVVRFQLTGLPVESIAASLAKGGHSPLNGGTLDISLDGTWAKEGVGFLDLPLAVTLHGVAVDLPGGIQVVDGVTLMFQVSGAIDDPTISFDDEALTETLVAAAKAQLTDEYNRRKDELVGEADRRKVEAQAALDAQKAEAQAKLDAELEGKLGKLLGGGNDQQGDGEVDPVEQVKEKAKQDLKSKARGVLGGLFGGKKKDDGDG